MEQLKTMQEQAIADAVRARYSNNPQTTTDVILGLPTPEELKRQSETRVIIGL